MRQSGESLLCSIALIFSLSAQSPQENQKPVIISGVVLNSATGEPVARASVEWRPVGRGTPVGAVTGADGRFRLETSASNGSITARRAGFQYARSTASENTETPVTLRMVPLGAVEGVVTDDEGEPLLNVTVQLLRLNHSEGTISTAVHAQLRTNDLGAYRLWELRPGTYLLRALGRSSTMIGVGAMPPTRESDLAYGPYYYPGATSFDEATRITIKPGETIRADMRLVGRRAYRIRGRMEGYAAYSLPKLALWQGRGEVGARVRINYATGEFEIGDVPAGSYTLKGEYTTTEGARAGETEVTVSNLDLSDVRVVLHEPVQVRASMRSLSGEIRTPIQLSLFRLASDGTPQGGENYSIELGRDGGQESEAFQPGRYRVMVNPWNQYSVIAVTSGNTDVLAEGLTVTESGCEPIEVVVSETGGSLDVVVDEPDSFSQMQVIAVRLAGLTPVITKSLMQAEDGKSAAKFPRIAPGVYHVYAFLTEDPIEYQNAAELRRYEGQAASVEVREGNPAQVHVKIIRASQTGGGQ